MQEIEKHDVASLCNRIADILFDEIEIVINAPLHRVGALDFAAVTVKAADRREKVSLAQIESEQANPAAGIEERLARFSKTRRPQEKLESLRNFRRTYTRQRSQNAATRAQASSLGLAADPFSLRGSGALTNEYSNDKPVSNGR